MAPAIDGLPAAEVDVDVSGPIATFLRSLSPRMLGRIRLALRVFEWLPFPWRFSRLDRNAREDFLRRMEVSRFGLFHELALTTVSTSKLARVSGATVIPYSSRRYEREARYEIRFHPPLPNFPTDDPVADTRRLVEVLERFIRQCPDQYQWTHKRFKGRPAELPDPYRDSRPGNDAP